MVKNKAVKKILVVDDEEGVLLTLQRLLVKKERSDLMVISASSGEEAMEKLLKERIDLVVTDIVMPGMSGLDLLVEIKNRFPYTSVIVMTAYPTPALKRETMLKGGLNFVEKPFDIDDLRQKIMAALQESSQFRGMLHGISLSDLIQIKCMSGVTDALRVTAEERQGVIFFHNGEIIHAICDDRDGEEAFYEIISFAHGHLDTVKVVELPERTIFQSYVSLLMEGARRLDEQGEEGFTEDEGPGRKEKVKGERAGQKLAPGVAATQPEPDLLLTAELLRGLKGIRGYQAAAIIDAAGEIVAQDAVNSSMDLRLIGGTLNEFFSNARDASAKIGLEACHEAVLGTRSEILIMGYGSGGNGAGKLVLSIFGSDGNQALGRSEMRKVVKRLAAGKK